MMPGDIALYNPPKVSFRFGSLVRGEVVMIFDIRPFGEDGSRYYRVYTSRGNIELVIPSYLRSASPS